MDENQLINQLNALGIQFISSDRISSLTDLQPDKLIHDLACSQEARLRLALIALFIQKPEYAQYVNDVHQTLPHETAMILKYYYSAAVCLQQKYKHRLDQLFGEAVNLPPIFFNQLGLDINNDPQRNLNLLAAHQRKSTGRSINWLGTYEHAAERLLIHNEKQY